MRISDRKEMRGTESRRKIKMIWYQYPESDPRLIIAIYCFSSLAIEGWLFECACECVIFSCFSPLLYLLSSSLARLLARSTLQIQIQTCRKLHTHQRILPRLQRTIHGNTQANIRMQLLIGTFKLSNVFFSWEERLYCPTRLDSTLMNVFKRSLPSFNLKCQLSHRLRLYVVPVWAAWQNWWMRKLFSLMRIFHIFLNPPVSTVCWSWSILNMFLLAF